MLATDLEPTQASRSSTTTSARPRTGYEVGHAEPGLPVQGPRRRDGRAGVRDGTQVHPGAEQPLPRRQPGQRRAVDPEPARHDLAARTCCRQRCRLRAGGGAPAVGGEAPAQPAAPSTSAVTEATSDGHAYETQAGRRRRSSPARRRRCSRRSATCSSTLRPGSIFFWDGDGAMDHDDSMRSLRLMGEEVPRRRARDGQGAGPSTALTRSTRRRARRFQANQRQTPHPSCGRRTGCA